MTDWASGSTGLDAVREMQRGPDVAPGDRVTVLARAAGRAVPSPGTGDVLPPGYCHQQVVDNPRSEPGWRVIAVAMDEGAGVIDATSWELAASTAVPDA